MAGGREIELFEAYARTRYRIDVAGSPAIEIGRSHPEIDELTGYRPWAFVTASNPRSVVLWESENQARHSRLLGDVRANHWEFATGRGEGVQGWKAEESLLVWGIDPAEAVSLARRYDQAAVVVGLPHGPADLVFLEVEFLAALRTANSCQSLGDLARVATRALVWSNWAAAEPTSGSLPRGLE